MRKGKGKSLVLIKEGDYSDEYVALDRHNNGKVCAHDRKLLNLLKKAKAKGVSDPGIVYVPKKGLLSFY